MKNALEQFRQQLATWINLRLSEHRLPFQKLEICPEIVTELGKLQPDMVLWINRDSQLAGSVILLPNVGDATICQYGRAMARALGLGHFTVWAAREVTIWDTAVNPVRLKTFSFPPAGEVDPIDFHHTLDALLEELKVVAITSAPENSALSTDYYVNLCLQTLQGLSPGLVESTRLTAGQNAADAWVNQTPQEKAWLSLWRLLFLLRQDLLPTGLQPERIEAALGYALEESSASSPLLKIQDSEPPLPESCAVRLHHLSGRLRQLGWPHSNQEAKETIDRLLSEAAQQFNLAATNLPWDISAQLWIKVPPRCEAPKPSIVAPKGFLAGWDNPLCHSGDKTTLQAQNVYELPASQSFEGIVALLDDQESPTRSERNHRQLSLRQTWPNRRFDLPRTAPRWLWDLLHLAGMDATDLHLILPYDWRFASGIDLLWPELTRDFQLIEAATLSSTQQALRWRRQKASHSQISFHRQ
ncbi:MAG: hypothetical protein OET90_05960, partial [Desulfuromonadales bacterium]|nr:hypothetical protein [Desulfuromonadales bacterium]